MTAIPAEARNGLMRAWPAILHEKHPEFTWIAVEQEPSESESSTNVADSFSSSDVEAAENELVVQAA